MSAELVPTTVNRCVLIQTAPTPVNVFVAMSLGVTNVHAVVNQK